ncbi:uncharacterized protein PgNI_12484 [Pyricularia grisea]|uniref:Uncharacterized protein n=1 Tax=Pyricularia grisea TaxID=148305 RepID=A0A6P8AMB2_PYRGI|nr:uncharacterized protein PgNI_12484 [Pyricularia grisea]TLD03173.1 hypothetical protein PgNI_12484 [Pyricularia grisea]
MHSSTVAWGFALVSAIISGAAADYKVPDTVYRGDHRSPLIIYRQGGFFPRGRAVGVAPDPNFPYSKHIDFDAMEDDNLKSSWLSVTSEWKAAKLHIRFAVNENQDQDTYVYHINTKDPEPILFKYITACDVIGKNGQIKKKWVKADAEREIAAKQAKQGLAQNSPPRVGSPTLMRPNSKGAHRQGSQHGAAQQNAHPWGAQNGAAVEMAPLKGN